MNNRWILRVFHQIHIYDHDDDQIFFSYILGTPKHQSFLKFMNLSASKKGLVLFFPETAGPAFFPKDFNGERNLCESPGSREKLDFLRFPP